MTRTERLSRILIPETAALKDAVELLTRTGLRTVLLTDADGRLSGILTDGDLRRALLAGVTLYDPAAQAANRRFLALPEATPPDEVASYLSDRIMLVPLVDADGRPTDFATRQAQGFVPAAEPVIGERELANVMDCVRSGWISSQGSYVSRFEAEFADYVGSPTAVSVSNGTAALHLSLAALGIGPGDAVIVPDLTFAASINAVLHAGATPVIVDVLPGEMTIDPDALARAVTQATKAVMPVHLYGQMCRMDAIAEIAEAHGLAIVEDAAEALGSRWRGRHAGTFGEAGTFSFFGNKLITTGEGGMAVFRDAETAARARMLRDHGMDPKRRYWHLDMGYNYRMTNMQAAVGCAQLDRVGELLAAKLNLAAMYSERLGDLGAQLTLPEAIPDTVHSFWGYVVGVRGPQAEAEAETERLIGFMREREIDVRRIFYPLHVMPPYRETAREDDCPVSTDLGARGIMLPSSPKLTEAQVDHVCDTLRAALDAVGVERLLQQTGS